jgi:hypothetical protein
MQSRLSGMDGTQRRHSAWACGQPGDPFRCNKVHQRRKAYQSANFVNGKLDMLTATPWFDSLCVSCPRFALAGKGKLQANGRTPAVDGSIVHPRKTKGVIKANQEN